MKKIALTMMMVAGLLISCSTDDQTVINENGAGQQSIQNFGDCTDAVTLGGSAVLSGHTGLQVTFNWNNSVAYSADKTYVSYIEFAEDTTCPAPAGAAPVAATYAIDVFNTSSLTIPGGVSAKCFYWRIVINGYTGSVVDCNTVT